MFFDEIIYFIANYGLSIVSVLSIIKLILLFWYKPHRPAFILKNFFKLYLNMAYVPNRELANKKWPFFKKAHNLITIGFYSLFFLWGIFFLLLSVSKR